MQVFAYVCLDYGLDCCHWRLDHVSMKNKVDTDVTVRPGEFKGTCDILGQQQDCSLKYELMSYYCVDFFQQL